MFKRFSVLTYFSILASALNAQEIDGAMRCTVQSNQITQISNGRVTTHGAIQGSFEKEDVLKFHYTLSEDRSTLEMSLIDEDRGKNLVQRTVGAGLFDLRWTKFNEGDDPLLAEGPFGGASFGRNYIRISRPGYELKLTRYYQSDWQGAATGYPFKEGRDLLVHTYTLDCRHITQNLINDVVDKVRAQLRP